MRKFCEDIEDEERNFVCNSEILGELVEIVKHRPGISDHMSYIHPSSILNSLGT